MSTISYTLCALSSTQHHTHTHYNKERPSHFSRSTTFPASVRAWVVHRNLQPPTNRCRAVLCLQSTLCAAVHIKHGFIRSVWRIKRSRALSCTAQRSARCVVHVIAQSLDGNQATRCRRTRRVHNCAKCAVLCWCRSLKRLDRSFTHTQPEINHGTRVLNGSHCSTHASLATLRTLLHSIAQVIHTHNRT